MRRICSSCLWLSITLACSANSLADADCARWEAQRARVHEQLRRPHGAAQGNRLRARLRELGARIAHGCR